ncbi:MAG TPA: STAS/SEC14 domain-containing protein [Alphaproteobacteria bacterium]|nr:STAS/SEC14 domain-containing protein [Micavibrio sp.]MBK9562438.1 STAS/SEC14 domain-containing protein [Micavibrio sp.]HQX26791.1 STAS/SEC14 domain-containing protein [Alphaproteobacteria bacterium]
MGQMIKKTCSDTNIITLPESDDSTLCVTYTNIVDVEEYETCVCDPIAEMVDKGHKFGMLVNYDDEYKGWSKEAAARSFQFIIDHGKYARKFAYVNPPEARIFQVKMTRKLFGGEIRFFEAGKLDEALQWIKN